MLRSSTAKAEQSPQPEKPARPHKPQPPLKQEDRKCHVPQNAKADQSPHWRLPTRLNLSPSSAEATRQRVPRSKDPAKADQSPPPDRQPARSHDDILRLSNRTQSAAFSNAKTDQSRKPSSILSFAVPPPAQTPEETDPRAAFPPLLLGSENGNDRISQANNNSSNVAPHSVRSPRSKQLQVVDRPTQRQVSILCVEKAKLLVRSQ